MSNWKQAYILKAFKNYIKHAQIQSKPEVHNLVICLLMMNYNEVQMF